MQVHKQVHYIIIGYTIIHIAKVLKLESGALYAIAPALGSQQVRKL